MKQFACGDIVPGCSATFEGDSDDAILGQVAAHARADHGMDEVQASLVDQVRAAIRPA